MNRKLSLWLLFGLLLAGCGTSLPTEPEAIGDAGLMRQRPVRPSPPSIVRVDSWKCGVVGGGEDWAFYDEAGIVRTRTAPFPCPLQALAAHPEWGNGARRIIVLDSGMNEIESIAEKWPE